MSTSFRELLNRGNDMSDNEERYGWYFGVNRYVCSTLKEMRACVKQIWNPIVRRHLISLIEEAQTQVNRMESALSDWEDIREGRKMLNKMEAEHKALLEEIKQLRAEKAKLKKTK